MENTRNKLPLLLLLIIIMYSPLIMAMQVKSPTLTKTLDLAPWDRSMGDSSDEESSDSELFAEREKETLDNFFNLAPAEIHQVVHDIQNYSSGSRAVFFTGKSGVGKTTFARAIAYHLKDEWTCSYKDPWNFRTCYRGKTAYRLENFFARALNKGKKNLIILNDINSYLNHADSKYHDSKLNAKVISKFLNKHRNDENFFFIGVLYSTNLVTNKVKNMMPVKWVRLHAPRDIEHKKRIFRSMCEGLLDAECDDQFLNEFLQKSKGWSLRSLEHIVDEAVEVFWDEHEINGNSTLNDVVITQEYLNRAFAELDDTRRNVLKMEDSADSDGDYYNLFKEEWLEKEQQEKARKKQ